MVMMLRFTHLQFHTDMAHSIFLLSCEKPMKCTVRDLTAKYLAYSINLQSPTLAFKHFAGINCVQAEVRDKQVFREFKNPDLLCLSAVLICFGVGVLVATGPIARLRAELVAVLDPLLLLGFSSDVPWPPCAPVGFDGPAED